MPLYKKHPSIIPFSMFCPGISSNSDQLQLNIYKGQVYKAEYTELCSKNIFFVAFDKLALLGTEAMMDKDGKLIVRDSPNWKNLADTQISWDSEIVESFVKGRVL